jgi:ParB-like chromosome segregation protein Spo0J
MSSSVKVAFHLETVLLSIESLVPSHALDVRERNHEKYKQIAASVEAVGVIEPLVVFPMGRGKYKLLDGHKRLDILIGRKVLKVDCLVSTDDESFTYNKRVNYLSPVGEHHMILRALEHNSEDRIAKALNVNVTTIRRKRDLLDGVCKEAVDALKDRRVSPKAFAALRKMKPVRQIEAAELMRASNMYSARFSQALVAGTRDDMLVEPQKDRLAKSVTSAQKVRMEHETDSLLRNMKVVEQSYGTEVLTLSVSCRYINTLLANTKVRKHLTKQHPEILRELRSVVASARLDLSRSTNRAKGHRPRKPPQRAGSEPVKPTSKGAVS